MTDTAVKTAEKVRKDDEKAAEQAVADRAKRAEIEADFRDAVAKAAEKRDKALEKLGSTNIAEQAWNDVKADEDPLYKDVTPTFRQKLDDAFAAVKATGSAGVVGLEAFEARCVELLAEEADDVPEDETAKKPVKK